MLPISSGVRYALHESLLGRRGLEPPTQRKRSSTVDTISSQFLQHSSIHGSIRTHTNKRNTSKLWRCFHPAGSHALLNSPVPKATSRYSSLRASIVSSLRISPRSHSTGRLTAALGSHISTSCTLT